VFYALCLGFCWVEVLKLGVVKPFTCVRCMAGWFALGLGVWQQGWHGIILCPVAVFIGAIYSAIQMRYL